MSTRSPDFQEELLIINNQAIPRQSLYYCPPQSWMREQPRIEEQKNHWDAQRTDQEDSREWKSSGRQIHTCKDQSANNSQQNTRNWNLSLCCQKKSHQLASKFSKKYGRKSKHGKWSDAGMPIDTDGNFPLPNHEPGKNLSQHLIRSYLSDLCV